MSALPSAIRTPRAATLRKQEAILAEAERQFARFGFEGVSLDSIAATLDQKEYGAYQATCRVGKFDSMVYGPLTPFIEPDSFLFGQYYTGEPRNRSHVNDPALDDLLVQERVHLAIRVGRAVHRAAADRSRARERAELVESVDRAGRVLVGPDCTLPGRPEVFVIGDMACFLHQGGKPLPAATGAGLLPAR